MYGGKEMCVQGFGGEPEGMRPLIYIYIYIHIYIHTQNSYNLFKLVPLPKFRTRYFYKILKETPAAQFTLKPHPLCQCTITINYFL